MVSGWIQKNGLAWETHAVSLAVIEWGLQLDASKQLIFKAYQDCLLEVQPGQTQMQAEGAAARAQSEKVLALTLTNRRQRRGKGGSFATNGIEGR